MFAVSLGRRVGVSRGMIGSAMTMTMPMMMPMTMMMRRGMFTYESKMSGGMWRVADALVEEAESYTGGEEEGGYLSASEGKRLAELTHVVRLSAAVRELEGEVEVLNELAEMGGEEGGEEELEAEFAQIKSALAAAEGELVGALVPEEEEDGFDVVVEIRAGAGGGEASLFASEMFGMYAKAGAKAGWGVEVLQESVSGVGGSSKIVAEVKDNTHGSSPVYGALKYESGVHRVQRIPETETTGRVHTSTVSVAVLPVPPESKGGGGGGGGGKGAAGKRMGLEIPESDLRIDTYRASGAGGQHVNTTDSAVRITHIPTGVVVTMQDERSQHKNKRKALKILGARLYEAQLEARRAEQAEMRNALIGSADRSERIRTYNFPQSRITDHRIGHSEFGIEAMMDGELLGEFTSALKAAALDAKLKAME